MGKKSRKQEMIDVVLEFNNTPRRDLYEYPLTAHESDRILASAGRVVDRILEIHKRKESKE